MWPVCEMSGKIKLPRKYVCFSNNKNLFFSFLNAGPRRHAFGTKLIARYLRFQNQISYLKLAAF